MEDRSSNNKSARVVVSDESGTSGSQRFQSVAFVSGHLEEIRQFNRTCRLVLEKHELQELKWSEVRRGQMFCACKEAITCLFKDSLLRVLVLAWDREDKRHKIQGRDDRANFHRMLYHGLRRNADWHREPSWRWFHDEMTDLDQDEIRAFLNGTLEDKGYQKHPELFHLQRELLDFREVRQVSSRETPLIGVADLFAGVVRESRQSGLKMHRAFERSQTTYQSVLDLVLEEDEEFSQG